MKKNAQQAKTTNKWVSKIFITVNRPTITQVLTDVTLSDMPCQVRGAKIAVEIGSKGNLHKHMYVALSRSVRLSWFYNNFPGCESVPVTAGTEQTVIDYIGGDAKSAEKGSIVLSDYTAIIGDIETTQGSRTDISATDNALWDIKDAIDGGANIRQIWQDFFPYMVRYGRGISDYMQMLCHEKKEEETQDYYKLKDIEIKKQIAAEIAAMEEIEAERLLIAAIRDKALDFAEKL